MNPSAASRTLIDSQIRANGIEDEALLRAMAKIGREVFLPKPMRRYANLDTDQDIGHGRSLIAPLTLARLLEAAAIRASDVALCIGDASGYATAVVAGLAQTVVSLECDADLVRRATQALADLGIDNAAIVRGPLARGLPGQAPFDVIVLAGAVAAIPAALEKQLAEGGRLIAVVGQNRRTGKIMRVMRVGEGFGRQACADAAAVALPGFDQAPGFVF